MDQISNPAGTGSLLLSAWGARPTRPDMLRGRRFRGTARLAQGHSYLSLAVPTRRCRRRPWAAAGTFWKQRQLEQGAYHFSAPPGYAVCDHCVDDDALAAFIRENAGANS